MVTAQIIDDEPYSCIALVTLLEKYCPEIKISGVCHSASDGLKSLENARPDILFLDIEMPHKTGFELLEELPVIDFELIFTTSYDQYAIKAIRFSAMDYLLKPIDAEELQAAVRKAVARRSAPHTSQIELLLQRFSGKGVGLQRIAIPTLEGLQMLPVAEIIKCSASRNYTILFLKGGRKLFASKSLKEIEEMLLEFSFFRVHHSSLVNLNEVDQYVRGEGGNLIMSDRSSVDVSRSRKDLLLNKLFPGRK